MQVSKTINFTLTSMNKYKNRFPLFLIILKAWQHKSTNLWNFSDGLSPPFMTYAISEVNTNGVRSLIENRCILYFRTRVNKTFYLLKFPNIWASPKNFPKSM